MRGYDPDKYADIVDKYMHKEEGYIDDDETANGDELIKMVGHDPSASYSHRKDYTILNDMRRDQYAKDKDLINAQKRAAYASRKGLKNNSVNAIFESEEVLERKFEKHHLEFGDISQKEYLSKARELASADIKDQVEEIVRSDRSRSRYNRETNEFMVLTDEGKIKHISSQKMEQNIGSWNMKETNSIPCPVCGHGKLDEYDICDVCGWENDPIQLEHPNLEGGANEMSLEQARKAYRNKERGTQ